MSHNFRFCPYCGGELRGDFRFCPYCGASLESTRTAQNAPEPRTPERKAPVMERVSTPQPIIEPEEFQRGFSLSYIPVGKVTSKEKKLNIHIGGVNKNFAFDGSKGIKLGKLRLTEALRAFEKLPKSYPRSLSENDNLIQFEVNHRLYIGLSPIDEEKYRIVAIIGSGHVYAGAIVFTVLEDADYDEAVEAIKRYYREGDEFLKNAYKAKEKFLEEKETSEGKYLLKIPGVFIRYDTEAYISSVLYLVKEGLKFYPHDGNYLHMEMPEDLPYFAREGIEKIKFNKKYTEMEITYRDDNGRKKTFTYAFLIPEEGRRYYQILSSEFPGRVKVKGGWFG
ncbi:zinc ribbon domain-containing protein [Thermococcus sp. SY098]|uniref:zinc ribbon domain-containing protein n=1 Tax=Thermococcus sp. SY098 TaxID=3111325 RepID=UPI002D797D12|nr:zinc ribbon domain-containing protein [Thermococcus sp. SY098]WRS53284.1 zinc ribbon domain-containing protein [Thermococcus sp. SY098]